MRYAILYSYFDNTDEFFTEVLSSPASSEVLVRQAADVVDWDEILISGLLVPRHLFSRPSLPASLGLILNSQLRRSDCHGLPFSPAGLHALLTFLHPIYNY